MIKNLYSKIVLKHPLLVLFPLLEVMLFFCFFATKLEIDASSETLLLEDDKDLKFSRQMTQRYKTPDFLVVTYSPYDELLSDTSLNRIEKISNELKKLSAVESITSIVNVPLLQSPVLKLDELTQGIRTLKTKDIDKELVKNEFLTSPLYKENLVSADFKTTAILINLKNDDRYFELLYKRNDLLKKKKESKATKEELIELEKAKANFKAYRDELRVNESENIENIRAILKKYESEAKMFLGGVSMIANDVVGFVKNDLYVYGTSLILILMLILWIIFRQVVWIVLPILICFLSIVATSGALGFFGWEITVISSNFIAMQLIITISIVLHLIVRYRELTVKYTKSSQYKLVLNTILSKINPSFFAILTTIAGFSSLILSNIQPVVNLGWMMSVGIALSLVISFIVFPAILIILPIKRAKIGLEKKIKFTLLCANIVEKRGKLIAIGTSVLVLLSILGANKLIVENSFINYFKQDTEIYKSMVEIDQNLGGTTPLDIVLTFKEQKKEEIEQQEEPADEFDSFDDEFEEDSNDAKYWFTKNKMEKIKKVHNYLKSIDEIGNVQSFGTLLEIGKMVNENKELDSFKLALLYSEIPQEYKQMILSPYLNIENNQVRFSTRIVDSNEQLRRDELIKRIQNDLVKIVPDDEIRVSNLMVLYNNMLQSLFDSQIKSLGFVIIILFLMFLILFKSVKIALIAVVSNIVPIGIVFAIMGFAKIPLDIMTITIAAISIGIGVDDTIHYIHRFKEELKKDHDYVKAMKRSHDSIGFAMTYTTLVVMMGFSILVLSNLIPTIYFGILTVLVMITILFAALLLLPKLLLVFKPL